MEFGRTTGDIQCPDIRRLQIGDNLKRGLPAHHLSAAGARVDVAVQAALIARVAQVDLQCIKTLAADGGKIAYFHQRQGGVHSYYLQ